MKWQEDEAGVGSGAAKAETGDGEGAANFRDIFRDGGNLPTDFPGVFERSSGGSLNGDDEISLIFGGNEALRHFAEDEVGETESGGEQESKRRTSKRKNVRRART